MSVEHAKKFLEKMKEDADFAEKIKNAKDIEETKAIIKEADLDFTEDELAQAQQGELDDEQLDAVAGGGYMCFGDTDICNHD